MKTLPFLRRSLQTLVAAAALAGAPLMAQTVPAFPVPENVVQLNASATVEVPQDTLSFVLAATREGTDPGQIQTQLRDLAAYMCDEGVRVRSRPNAIAARVWIRVRGVVDAVDQR